MVQLHQDQNDDVEEKHEVTSGFPNPPPIQKSKTDELHETASVYYENVSGNIKAAAEEFFSEMDKDGDRQVSLHEYLAFMKQKGQIQMANPQFFKELNRSGTGKLSFMEVMTLYYIVQSGRPYCDGCGAFITGIFFACVECFDKEGGGAPFFVCPNCLKDSNFVHGHDHFLDNYALLETKRVAALRKKKQMENTPENLVHESSSAVEKISSSSTLQIVIYERHRNPWVHAVSAVCQAAAATCSIM